MESKKYYVDIYCKIYTDTYNFIPGEYTGNEIYAHLVASAGHVFNDEIDELNPPNIPGDHNIWYLGSNEKFGHMIIREIDPHFREHLDFHKSWGFGESSYDNVDQFINYLHDNKVINEIQFGILSELVKKGRAIGDMYDIVKYLKKETK